MYRRTEGIVLRSSLFGEADLIVTYFTLDYGVQRLFAKSPRKIRSRFGSSLEPLSHCSIAFLGKEDANLPRLVQSDILNPFQALRTDYRCYAEVTDIVGLVLKMFPEKDPDKRVFRLLLSVFNNIECDPGAPLHYLYAKLQLLSFGGYAPCLDMCGKCGEKNLPGDRQFFYPSYGSVLCAKCNSHSELAVQVSSGGRKFYESLVRWQPEKVGRIRPNIPFLSEINKLIQHHIEFRYMNGK